jgi:hypothetical protein
VAGTSASIRFEFIERTASQALRAFLGSDDVLQDEPSAMVRGDFRGKCGHEAAGFVQADGAENGARGKVAIASIDHVGADDVDRRTGGAQHRLSHRTH